MPLSVTTVTPLRIDDDAVKLTALPPLRVRVNASATEPANVTWVLNATVRFVTRERWADPSLTWAACTVGAARE